MKALSIDYGRRRIGMAVAGSADDPVRPLATVDRLRHPAIIDHLSTIISREKPDVVVIGLPLDSEENETSMAVEIKAFAGDIGRATGVSVRFIDESYSSVRAQELMRHRKKKARRDKAAVDRIAACLLLESFQREMLSVRQPETID